MNQRLTLQAHDKDLGGGSLVRRLLPSAQRQAVRPFLFFDYFGPVTAQPSDKLMCGRTRTSAWRRRTAFATAR